MTDKFSKSVKLVPGKETWSAKEWAVALWDNVVRHWGLPRAIISDRDPKFTSAFWREVMEECRVILRLTTAYNPRSDGQSERMNRVVKNPNYRLIMRNLYWRARRQSTIWDVFGGILLHICWY